MDGFIRLSKDLGYNLNNLVKWTYSNGELFLYFSGDAHSYRVTGQEAIILKEWLAYQSTDIVKKYTAAKESEK